MTQQCRMYCSSLVCIVALVGSACSANHSKTVDKTTDEPAAVSATPTAAAPTDAAGDSVSAAEMAKIAEVEAAIDNGLDINQSDDAGRTLLMMASFEGRTAMARLLIEHGAPVDARDAQGRTALMYAASGPFAETVALLINSGADVNAVDQAESWSALMFAAGEGHLAVVRTLLDAGADPDLTDQDGDRAEDHAHAAQHPEVADMLSGTT